MNKRPQIPHPRTEDRQLQRTLLAIKQNIDIANGVVGGTNANQTGWQQRSVTLGMLIKLGVITEAEAMSVVQEP